VRLARENSIVERSSLSLPGKLKCTLLFATSASKPPETKFILAKVLRADAALVLREVGVGFRTKRRRTQSSGADCQ